MSHCGENSMPTLKMNRTHLDILSSPSHVHPSTNPDLLEQSSSPQVDYMRSANCWSCPTPTAQLHFHTHVHECLLLYDLIPRIQTLRPCQPAACCTGPLQLGIVRRCVDLAYAVVYVRGFTFVCTSVLTYPRFGILSFVDPPSDGRSSQPVTTGRRRVE
ncbi:unnamed protein product [Protopolystoma xenopodis]|uniref:Uncharacterized protein n=1 Tax=Protopolystoma xenopodis TaxID=117903 RepID=A0A448X4W3_9PLAT|nr:unnamed protein product [Protopolystoma xenopodis]